MSFDLVTCWREQWHHHRRRRHHARHNSSRGRHIRDRGESRLAAALILNPTSSTFNFLSQGGSANQFIYRIVDENRLKQVRDVVVDVFGVASTGSEGVTKELVFHFIIRFSEIGKI